jgi:hypothetical protein
MNAVSRVCVALVPLLVFGSGRAADAPARAATPAASAPVSALPASSASTSSTTVRLDVPATDQPREPVVQRTVIDDGRAMIEELRVRGQLVKVTVHPKDGAPSYDIIVGDGSRELSTEGRNNSRGATGKRVWQVLSF